MRWRWRGTCVAVALCVARSDGLGQEVRGVLLLPDGTTATAGVLVELVTPTRVTVARAVTTAAGGFTLRAPGAGRYRARALRIGYRPTESDEIVLEATGVAEVRLTLTDVAISIAAVEVRGRSSCRPMAGAGAEVATVWEEARKALALASITAASRRHQLEVVTYERDLGRDAYGPLVTRETSRVVETSDARAFRSVPVDSLLREGFVVQRGDALEFFGPDADVLLSDDFVAAHCLRLVAAPDGDTSAVALAFEPAARRDVIGVRGTLTLSRATAELRALAFRYVGLPDEASEAGGRLEYARLSDGAWVVRRWELQMPVLDVETGGARSRATPARDEPRVAVRALRAAGGEVLRVTVDGEEVERAATRRLAGRVEQAEGGAAVARARVSLEGTVHEAQSDADGGYELRELLPARYRVAARTPMLDSIGGVAPGGVVDLRNGDVTGHTIAVPSAEVVYRELCRVVKDDRKGALLRVTVRDPRSGTPIPGARVQLRWGGVEHNDRVLGRQQERVLETEENGSVAYCGVPRNVLLRLRAFMGDGASPEQQVTISPLRPFQLAELRVTPR